MKKLFLFFILFFSFLNGTFAESERLEFSIFTRDNCVHCIRLWEFLENNTEQFTISKPKYYSLNEKENLKIFSDFTSKNNISKVTPIILIGNEIIIWYKSDETTGKYILDRSKTLTQSSYFETYEWSANTIEWWLWCSNEEFCTLQEDSSFNINIPFLWKVNLKDYSLLFLATILWFVDGFNPCAMWVLIMFVSILAQTGSRKKMFQVAWVFILAEAIMYYMILNVWYKTWDFIQLDNIITPIIWIISASAGAYFVYEFFTNQNGECKVISWNQKKKTIDKIKLIASKPMTIGVFFLTIFIAFSVNIVEFACSIGIPQAFTKLLEMSSLWFFEKQIYILIYTLFYMIDDFIVFGIAIYAMSYLSLTTKYTRYCLLIGWIIMLILWYFFLFNPVALKMIIS